MNGTYTQRRRMQMAGGGITNVRPRQGYFLGDLVDKVKNVVSPILQYAEPITGIARYVGDLMNIGSAQASIPTGMPQGSPGQINTPPIFPEYDDYNYPGIGDGTKTTDPTYIDKIYRDFIKPQPELTGQEPGILQKIGQTIIPGGETGYFDLYGGLGSLTSPSQIGNQEVQWKIPLGIGLAAGELQKRMSAGDVLPKDETGINIADIRRRALTGSDPDLHFLPPASATTAYADGGRIGYAEGKSFEAWLSYRNKEIAAQRLPVPFKEWQKGEIDLKAQGGRIGYDDGGIMMAMSDESNTRLLESLYEDFLEQGFSPKDAATKAQEAFDEMSKAPGRNRVMAQEGGLMNLGGMEKDYRQEGGFVPIGGEEKADDVPARLSKNEFVFTADAVRAAGGGNIDAGAEVMENLMEHLEAGGKVSEDSQGLEGAQAMFANTQRLQNRII